MDKEIIFLDYPLSFLATIVLDCWKMAQEDSFQGIHSEKNQYNIRRLDEFAVRTQGEY